MGIQKYQIKSKGRAISFSVDPIRWLDPKILEHNREPHRHEFYSVFFIHKGKVIHTIDGHDYIIDKETVFTIPANYLHQLIMDNKVDGWVLVFDPNEWMLDSKINLQTPVILSMSKEECSRIEKIVKEIQQQHSEKNEHHKFAIIQLMHYIFILLQQFQRKENVTRNNGVTRSTSIYHSFKNMIPTNYQQYKEVHHYSEQLKITPALLNKITKSVSGLTAGEEIRQYILSEAKRMLQQTTLSAKEIAHELGFDDSHYFSRFFKKNTGKSITAFRNH
jgi:AraC family transcriptional regulator, transcriptional activator of pobA